MSYYDSPEFRRQSNAVADSGLKLFSKGLTIAITAIINSVRAIVAQIFGK